MTWNDKYTIGVPLIDAQHRALFHGIERIYTILADHDSARDRRMTEDAVFFLEQHALQHFKDEEAYMLSIQDASYPLHKAQHAAILKELKIKKEEIISSNYSSTAIRKLLGTMLSWLTYHTLEVDQLIGKTIAAPAQSSPAVVALEQAITQVMTDMLQITPALVDPSFNGSFYGNELFCSVSGSVATSESLHILYAVDMQVIEQAVSTMLGISVSEADDFVLSAFEELCRVLSIHFVKKYRNNAFFHINDSGIVSQEHLLTSLPDGASICHVLFNDSYGSFSIQVWQNALDSSSCD